MRCDIEKITAIHKNRFDLELYTSVRPIEKYCYFKILACLSSRMFSKVSSYLWRQASGPPGYEMKEETSEELKSNIWSLHSGVKKVSKEEVSIFMCELKSKSPEQIQLAKNSIQKLKTLKHPSILRFLDSSETSEALFLVTEPVLSVCSASMRSSEVTCYGLYSIAKVLAFLNEDCGAVFGNLSLNSIFVSPSLDWKLGGFEYFTKFDSEVTESLPKGEMFSPPEVTNSTGRTTQHTIDAWGLGCLIWQLHNGDLDRQGQLKNPGSIPPLLSPLVAQLLHTRVGSRLTVRAFLERGEAPCAYFDNWYVKLNKWIEEMQILSADQRQGLYETISERAERLESGFCRFKALPTLVHAFDFCGAQSLVLQPLLKIGSKVGESDYQTRIVPCLVKMFVSPDRATRISLLQTISTYVAFLTQDVVSNQIYPHLMHGFNDTSVPIREHTIHAIGVLAPKLSSTLINQNLLKHLAKSQMDPQPTVRNKTNVCLGKLSPFLDVSTRSKVLCSAYTRGLKDTDALARETCLTGLVEGTRYLTAHDMAHLVIPSLSPHLLDSDESFRAKVSEGIAHFVQTVSAQASDPEALKQQGLETGGENTWTSWALGSISGLYKTKQGAAVVNEAQDVPPQLSAPDPTSSVESSYSSIEDTATKSQATLKLSAHNSPINIPAVENNGDNSDSDYEAGGWGDDWGQMPPAKDTSWEDFDVVENKGSELERKREERKLKNEKAREERQVSRGVKLKGIGAVKKVD